MGRRLLAPEVIQTSAMDCGPASLKCLLEGFGIGVSYGRLREACQTDVDGTSIDTLEEVAGELGLECEQVMVPVDHVLLSETKALPSIVVVRLPSGATHFVVLWRSQAGLVQVMDPATGRRFSTPARLLEHLYVHEHKVPASAFREWAGSEGFLGPFLLRLRALGIGGGRATKLVAAALADESASSIAALDAAVRMVASIVRAGGLLRGREAQHAVERLATHAAADSETIPKEFWTAAPTAAGDDGTPRVLLRGAVLVRASGRRSEEVKKAHPAAGEHAPKPRSPELEAALLEPRARPGLELWRLIVKDGLFAPSALTFAMLLAAGGVLVEAVLLRGLFELGRELGIAEQRLAAVAALLVFLGAMLCLELPLAAGLWRYGRRLELRLRIAFLEKLPRLGDRYFRSRLTSDMAERSHSVHMLRTLPLLASQLLRAVFTLLFTAAGIVWLDPECLLAVGVAALCAVVLPLIAQAPLMTLDLRQRSHAGALSRYYLDAMLGLFAVRTHGAERTLRRGHEGLLVSWLQTGRSLQRAALVVEGLQSLVGLALVSWLLLGHLERNGASGGTLLLAYWALALPALGQGVAQAARQYPAQRNVALRLTEPLGAPEEEVHDGDAAVQAHAYERSHPRTALEPPLAGVNSGVAIALLGATVRASGHTILEDVTLEIAAGSHVAIVGPSGAGKSTLVGVLLGWQRLAAGHAWIDGAPLDTAAIARLRAETAWVDPAVQLWNRSVIDNLRYGAPDAAVEGLAALLDTADLHRVLERLPDGLQTKLGEGGALVSGGEGQRMRLGRALLRPGVRLAILDEPLRGLDRERRHALLGRMRAHFRDQTLLCITHDVGETLDFDRVVVVEAGRVVEDGEPRELAASGATRYRALLDAEEAVRRGLWGEPGWRRLVMDDGRLREEPR